MGPTWIPRICGGRGASVAWQEGAWVGTRVGTHPLPGAQQPAPLGGHEAHTHSWVCLRTKSCFEPVPQQ